MLFYNKITKYQNRILKNLVLTNINCIFLRYNKGFGVFGVPSLYLIENGIPLFKFKGPDYSLYELTKFVMKHTGIHFI